MAQYPATLGILVAISSTCVILVPILLWIWKLYFSVFVIFLTFYFCLSQNIVQKIKIFFKKNWLNT